MRLLFVHAARDSASEYKVHRLLAQNADTRVIEAHFVCQDSPLARRENEKLSPELLARVTFLDFGRDMHSEPKPSRAQRAWLMGKTLPRALGRALAVARRINPDVIYASQQKYDVFLGRLLARLLGKPLLVHVHYNVGPWLGKSTLRGIQRADKILCVSDFIRRGAVRAGVPEARVHYVHNAADLRSFDVPRSRAALLSAFGFPDDALVAIAAGRIDPSKGHVPLLEAFARVVREVPRARLVVCGVSNTRDGFEDSVHQRSLALGLKEHVVFAGTRSDLPALFAGAHLFSLPTENDPCPLVFLEAMAAGLPTVAYRSGGVAELVADEETGLLVEVGDIDGLTERLLRLFRDETLARRLGEAGRSRATTEFEPGRITRQWEGLVRS